MEDAIAVASKGDGSHLSLEIAEVNPIFDRENRTAALAVELVASAFGQRIH